MLASLHVGRIGFGRRGNAHLRIDRLSNVNRSAPMPNLENLRKQAKLILRWHRDRYYPVAAQIRSGFPRYAQMTDSEILAQSFKLGDAQELVARQHGFESWQALKTGVTTMSDHADTMSTKAVITAAEPQLFVADIKASCDFFASKLGFAVAFTYGEPPFYAQVKRDGARINLRCVAQPVIDQALRDRDQLLSASLTVATAQEIKALFLEFQAAGVTFFQTLKREPWGARDFIVRDPDGNLLLFAGPAE
jgi:catechol 2,3-dioxygenase-like lactoylglutathione lyase family enzyme